MSDKGDPSLVENIGGQVIAGLLILAIGAVFTFVMARAVAKWRSKRKHHATETRASERGAIVERAQVLREQVREVARARGLTVADRAEGVNPVVVTFTDGRRSWFYRDHATYTRDANSGRCDPTRAWVTKPPRPVSRWDEATLEKWLEVNAT